MSLYQICVNGLCSGVSRCSRQKDDEPSSKCNLACVAGLMFWYAVVCSLKSGEQESLDRRLYYFLSLQASKDTQICQLHRIMEFSIPFVTALSWYILRPKFIFVCQSCNNIWWCANIGCLRSTAINSCITSWPTCHWQ